MRLKFKALLVFTLFFVSGFYTIFKIEKQNEIQRDPASLKVKAVFTDKFGEELVRAIAAELAKNLTLTVNEGDKYLQFDTFRISGVDGERTICYYYPRVIFEFEGDGSAESSMKPTMKAAGDCRDSEGVASIQPIVIPASIIRKEKVTDGIFEYKEKHNSASVTIDRVGEKWPNWALTNVKFFNNKTGMMLVVPSSQLREFRKEPFIVSFESTREREPAQNK